MKPTRARLHSLYHDNVTCNKNGASNMKNTILLLGLYYDFYFILFCFFNEE